MPTWSIVLVVMELGI